MSTTATYLTKPNGSLSKISFFPRIRHPVGNATPHKKTSVHSRFVFKPQPPRWSHEVANTDCQCKKARKDLNLVRWLSIQFYIRLEGPNVKRSTTL